MFWRNMSPPFVVWSCGKQSWQSRPNRALLATCVVLVSCLAYFSTQQMKATCFSEMSVDFQWTTHCYTPESRTLHSVRFLHVLKFPSYSSYHHLIFILLFINLYSSSSAMHFWLKVCCIPIGNCHIEYIVTSIQNAHGFSTHYNVNWLRRFKKL
jgi:hypothetical protein